MTFRFQYVAQMLAVLIGLAAGAQADPVTDAHLQAAQAACAQAIALPCLLTLATAEVERETDSQLRQAGATALVIAQAAMGDLAAAEYSLTLAPPRAEAMLALRRWDEATALNAVESKDMLFELEATRDGSWANQVVAAQLRMDLSDLAEQTVFSNDLWGGGERQRALMAIVTYHIEHQDFGQAISVAQRGGPAYADPFRQKALLQVVQAQLDAGLIAGAVATSKLMDLTPEHVTAVISLAQANADAGNTDIAAEYFASAFDEVLLHNERDSRWTVSMLLDVASGQAALGLMEAANDSVTVAIVRSDWLNEHGAPGWSPAKLAIEQVRIGETFDILGRPFEADVHFDLGRGLLGSAMPDDLTEKRAAYDLLMGPAVAEGSDAVQIAVTSWLAQIQAAPDTRSAESMAEIGNDLVKRGYLAEALRVALVIEQDPVWGIRVYQLYPSILTAYCDLGEIDIARRVALNIENNSVRTTSAAIVANALGLAGRPDEAREFLTTVAATADPESAVYLAPALANLGFGADGLMLLQRMFYEPPTQVRWGWRINRLIAIATTLHQIESP